MNVADNMNYHKYSKYGVKTIVYVM